MSEQSNDTGLGNVDYVVRSVEGATVIARGNVTKENREMSEWETFCDESYYHLWRVRQKSERGFNDGFHLQHGEEAKALVDLLNRLERERDEARESLENARELNKWLTVFLEHIRDNADIRYGKHRGLLAFSDLREEASRKWKEATK